MKNVDFLWECCWGGCDSGEGRVRRRRKREGERGGGGGEKESPPQAEKLVIFGLFLGSGELSIAKSSSARGGLSAARVSADLVSIWSQK